MTTTRWIFAAVLVIATAATLGPVAEARAGLGPAGVSMPTEASKPLWLAPAESKGQRTYILSRPTELEVNDPLCRTYMGIGIDVRGANSFTIPSRVDGEKVQGWRLTTSMPAKSSQTTCVVITDTYGAIVHTGHAGSWTTVRELAPGRYHVMAPGPGQYTVQVTVDLAAAGSAPTLASSSLAVR